MHSNKLTVGVLFGGVSSEHEISLLSAVSVLTHLDPDKYRVIPFGITEKGRWFRFDGEISLLKDGNWERSGQLTPVVFSASSDIHGVLVETERGLRPERIDLLFPVLHGKNGEDGTVQGLFELAGIPYVGCGVRASANCMDKDTAKRLLRDAGIPVARWSVFRPEDMNRFDAVCGAVEALTYPVFVKPSSGGSSLGVTRVENRAGLPAALAAAFRQDVKVLVEESVGGAEIECAVMGNRQNAVTGDVLGEIVPARGFYDYEKKYHDDSTEFFIPARVPETQTALLKETALNAFRALECAGLARVDFFAKPDGSVVLNEINTLPGFTDISMFPKLFLESGLSYSDLLDRLVAHALEEHIRL